MKVHNASSYGRLNLMIRPGVDEPTNDLWFEMIPGEYGELRRSARSFLIQFQDGAAEVDNELGRYLLEKVHGVSAEPVPFTAPPPGFDALSTGRQDSNRATQSSEWDQLYKELGKEPPRRPVMQVGSTMTPEVAASQARHLGERMKPASEARPPQRRGNSKKGPLQVGLPMNPKVAASQARRLGEKVRG